MSDQPDPRKPAPNDVWRHVKGGVYHIVDIVTMQCSTHRPLDMAEAVLYRNAEGRLWVRPLDEFMDGRFIFIGAPTPTV